MLSGVVTGGCLVKSCCPPHLSINSRFPVNVFFVITVLRKVLFLEFIEVDKLSQNH